MSLTTYFEITKVGKKATFLNNQSCKEYTQARNFTKFLVVLSFQFGLFTINVQKGIKTFGFEWLIKNKKTVFPQPRHFHGNKVRVDNHQTTIWRELWEKIKMRKFPGYVAWLSIVNRLRGPQEAMVSCLAHALLTCWVGCGLHIA